MGLRLIHLMINASALDECTFGRLFAAAHVAVHWHRFKRVVALGKRVITWKEYNPSVLIFS